jgi:hypothetical protein
VNRLPEALTVTGPAEKTPLTSRSMWLSFTTMVSGDAEPR